MVFVKICGLTNINDAKAAVEAGADGVGFLVDIPQVKISKQITVEALSEIVKKIPNNVMTFALTTSTDVKHIAEICKKTNVSAVQLYHEFEPKQLVELRKILPKTKIVMSFGVTDLSMVAKAQSYEPFVDYILLDSIMKTQIGGTGKIHDWKISAQVVSSCKKPVMLAGGLDASNVAAAIREVKPWGVDADTRLESESGKKDINKVKAFIREAKRG
jgi:phosphoribosylanthranilate isomerase